MKLIIVEGPDNCGKDTLINKISEKFLTVTKIHYTKPENKYIQNTIFRGYAFSIVNNVYNTDIIILNRSHYGEYVYGCLYRGISDNDAINIIYEIDNIYIKNDIDAYYIQLMCDSNKLLFRNDDGKSLSKNKIEKIDEEVKRFREIFDKSLLKKKLIYINNEDNFRTSSEIFDEAWSFINNNE
mgnify:CR=1 FL=1